MENSRIPMAFKENNEQKEALDVKPQKTKKNQNEKIEMTKIKNKLEETKWDNNYKQLKAIILNNFQKHLIN